MDIQQAARMIEWLDDERRRDKTTIATLQERLAQQQDVIDTLSKRINSVESDYSALRAQAAPATRDADLLEQMRREMAQVIEQVEAKRLTAEREAERRQDIARENALRPVRELQEKLSRVERSTTELPAINVEKDRIAGSVSSLQQRVEDLFKRFEDPERRLAYLEEQRRQDAKRLTDIEAEIPEVRKSVDNIRPKVTLIEELALRNERKVQEVVTGDRDRREQIQQFVDQQTLLIQQRDQQVQDLMRRFGEHETQMQRYGERFEQWSETYREMKRVIDDFNRLTERLERRLDEVGQMQKMSEERFRGEWNDWRADDQKRWKQFTASNDEIWRQHDKEFERFVKLLADVQTQFPPLQDSLNRLWNLERERAALYRERYQALLLAYDTVSGSSTLTGANGTGNGSPVVPANSPPSFSTARVVNEP